MRRILVTTSVVIATLTLGMSPAWAGSPHFVGAISITRTDNSLTVSGKEAGLGNETQVHIELSADAACINPGGQKPQADNKESFSVAGDFPVQNGKANFTLTLSPTFQPDCTPPMTVVFTDVVVCDTEHAICREFAGPF